MKWIGAVLTLALVGSLGFISGEAYSTVQEQPTYLVMSEFEIGTGQSFNSAVEELSGWVRLTRATGKHESVRLFMHDWGSKAALYMLVESDWDGIGAIFPDLLVAVPGFMDQPWQFSGHSDEILTEIPVQ